jgi:hypothetical protein
VNRCFWFVAVLLTAVNGSAPLAAKTITLTDADCDRMAVISEQAPRLSWACTEVVGGAFFDSSIDLIAGRAFLVHWPLNQIPKGQRITKAELSVPVALTSAGEQRLHVRRLLAPWGAGVCWQYRQVRSQRAEWTTPGARAPGKDRAARASAVGRVSGTADLLLNLTEDVELWYAGAASNHGWIMTIEDPDVLVRLHSPTWVYAGSFKLRITYEPE